MGFSYSITSIATHKWVDIRHSIQFAVYRPKLLRRLDTLTQQLSKSPPEYDDDDLEEATVITIEGKRVRKILRLDRFGKPINDQGSPKTQGKQISDYLVKKEKTGASVVKKDKEAEKSQSTVCYSNFAWPFYDR